jgi:hypothetical protein
VNVLHVEVSRITGDPLRLADAVSYPAREVCPAVERQPGSLATSLLIGPEAGAMGFESSWAPDGALPDSGDVIAASAGEAARRAGGTVTRERYAVLVFEHEAPPRGGQEARVTRGCAAPPRQLLHIACHAENIRPLADARVRHALFLDRWWWSTVAYGWYGAGLAMSGLNESVFFGLIESVWSAQQADVVFRS